MTAYPGVLTLQHGARGSFAKFRFQLETVSGFIPFPSLFTRVSFLGPLYSWDMHV